MLSSSLSWLSPETKGRARIESTRDKERGGEIEWDLVGLWAANVDKTIFRVSKIYNSVQIQESITMSLKTMHDTQMFFVNHKTFVSSIH